MNSSPPFLRSATRPQPLCDKPNARLAAREAGIAPSTLETVLLLERRSPAGQPRIIQAAAVTLELPGARIAAEAHTGGLPQEAHPTPFGLNPPDEWLMSLPTEVTASGVTTIDPYLTGPYIDAEGRVAIFAWGYGERGVCHNGSPMGPDVCWMPQPSPTGNRLFHQGTIVTASGVAVPGGGLMFGHAAAGSVLQAQQDYNSPDLFKVRGRILETDLGAYLVGSLQPGTTNSDVEILRASALSGDWRRIPELGGAFDSLGPVVVARPALPSFGEHLPSGTPQSTIDTVFWELVSQFVPEGITASGEFSSVSQRHIWRPVQESTMSDTLRRKIQRIAAAGVTSESRREAFSTQLNERFTDEFVFVQDFDDNYVYFEMETGGLLALEYTETNGSITVSSGEPQQAQRQVSMVVNGQQEQAVQASGSSCSCSPKPHGDFPYLKAPVQAAAVDLASAANQADMDTVMAAIDAMNERLDLIDTDIVQLKAGSLTADETSGETSGEIESS